MIFMKRKPKSSNAGDKRSSVQFKLMSTLIPIIVVAIVIIVLIVQFRTSAIIMGESEEILAANATSTARSIEAWSNSILSGLETEAKTIEANEQWTRDEQRAYQMALYDPNSEVYTGMYVATVGKDFIDPSDWVPEAGYDPTAQGWYTDSVNNNSFAFGNPYVDEDTGNMIVTAGRAIKSGNGTLRGVAAGDVDLSSTSEVVSQVKLKQTGGAYLVDSSTGIIIGAADSSATGKTPNELPSDSVYSQAAQWVRNNSAGFHKGSAEGKAMCFYLEWVTDSNWVTVCYVPESEILSDAFWLTVILVIIAIVAIAAVCLIIFPLISRLVLVPVKKLDTAAQRIADGDLNTKVDFQSDDEFGTLADNFAKTANRLHSYVDYINEISAVLNEVAHGNLDFRLELEYEGEFAKIKDALENISASLNDTISQIDASSQQVSAGAVGLSNSAQSLSQGAVEQAASVEELSATVNELSDQVKKNAEEAKSVNEQIAAAAQEVEQSNERMKELISSMTEINNTSMEIDKVIRIIEDIAFQTNILALNAAVEAARAGNAGKGFAVVADEVRSLANKSQEAAKNSADLIKAAVDAVQQGNTIADETASSLVTAAEDIRTITGAVNEMAKASDNQAVSISQVSEGIGQIAGVVQHNSATSEETAASSDRLSTQAQLLNGLVERFTLRSQQNQLMPPLQ